MSSSSPSSSSSSSASSSSPRSTSSTVPFLDPLQRAQLALENARLIRQQAVDATSYRTRIEKNIQTEHEELTNAKQALNMVQNEFTALEKETQGYKESIQEARQRLLQLLYCIKELLLVIDNDWDGDLPLLNDPLLLSRSNLLYDANLPMPIQEQLLTYSDLVEENRKEKMDFTMKNTGNSNSKVSDTLNTSTLTSSSSPRSSKYNTNPNNKSVSSSSSSFISPMTDVTTETLSTPTDEYIPPSLDMIRITYQILAEKLAIWFVKHPDIL